MENKRTYLYTTAPGVFHHELRAAMVIVLPDKSRQHTKQQGQSVQKDMGSQNLIKDAATMTSNRPPVRQTKYEITQACAQDFSLYMNFI